MRYRMSKQKEEATPFADQGMARVLVTCEGLTPLLMNRLTEETLEQIRTKTKPPKTAQSTYRTPREDAAPKVYEVGGKPYVPGQLLLSALIAAGQFVRLDGKRQVSTQKSTILPGFMTVETTELMLLGEGGRPATWEVDMRAGRNPNGGEAVCLCRPRFDRWSFDVSIIIDTREVGEQLVRQIFDIAGKRCGLGDFRPNRKGMFGQFAVRCWERQKERKAA